MYNPLKYTFVLGCTLSYSTLSSNAIVAGVAVGEVSIAAEGSIAVAVVAGMAVEHNHSLLFQIPWVVVLVVPWNEHHVETDSKEQQVEPKQAEPL